MNEAFGFCDIDKLFDNIAKVYGFEHIICSAAGNGVHKRLVAHTTIHRDTGIAETQFLVLDMTKQGIKVVASRPFIDDAIDEYNKL